TFFERYLPLERNLSPNTVLSYRDAMLLFLHYAAETLGQDPDRLEIAQLDAGLVRGFLEWLRRRDAARREQPTSALPPSRRSSSTSRRSHPNTSSGVGRSATFPTSASPTPSRAISSRPKWRRSSAPPSKHASPCATAPSWP